MAESRNSMTLRVVTPTGVALEEEAQSVALWTALGEIEVLPGHASIVVLLEPGEMRVRKDGGMKLLAAGEGFARIDGSSVTVFSDMAEDVGAFTHEEAVEAQRRAQEAMKEAAKMTEDERMAADLALRESVVKFQMSLRRKGATGMRE
jgi:F-type H+-transporting ATPase subunit epsilon